MVDIRDDDDDPMEAVKSKNISNVMIQRTFQVNIVFCVPYFGNFSWLKLFVVKLLNA